jgi:hypothetical protein
MCRFNTTSCRPSILFIKHRHKYRNNRVDHLAHTQPQTKINDEGFRKLHLQRTHTVGHGNQKHFLVGGVPVVPLLHHQLHQDFLRLKLAHQNCHIRNTSVATSVSRVCPATATPENVMALEIVNGAQRHNAEGPSPKNCHRESFLRGEKVI